MPSSPISTHLSVGLKKLLCRFGGYFNGQLHRFNLDANGSLSLTPMANEAGKKAASCPQVLIVARNCYQESARQYPVVNNKELKKLLALEFQDPSRTSYHSWGGLEGQSQVNIWQYDENVPAALLRIPESLLLAVRVPEQKIIHTQSVFPVFVARVGALIHSAVQGGVIDSNTRFAMSIGVDLQGAGKTIDAIQYPGELALGLKTLTPGIVGSLLQMPKPESSVQLLKQLVVPIGVVLGGYLAISSAYLAYQQHNLQQQLAGYSDEVSVALHQQLEFDSGYARYQALTEFLANQESISPLWLVMVELFPNAQFSNIRIVENRYVLRGKTKKATELLELISQQPFVTNAKFDFPTRKSRADEVFVISFKLETSQLVEHTKVDNEGKEIVDGGN